MQLSLKSVRKNLACILYYRNNGLVAQHAIVPDDLDLIKVKHAVDSVLFKVDLFCNHIHKLPLNVFYGRI